MRQQTATYHARVSRQSRGGKILRKDQLSPASATRPLVVARRAEPATVCCASTSPLAESISWRCQNDPWWVIYNELFTIHLNAFTYQRRGGSGFLAANRPQVILISGVPDQTTSGGRTRVHTLSPKSTRLASSVWGPLCLFWVCGACPISLDPLADAEEPAALRFTDISRQSGIDFVHTLGDDKMTNIVEATGVGCALFDYDGDGWLDLYLVSGIHMDGISDPACADKETLRQATDRLYRNRGDGTFEDVTDKVGILPGGYGMGVAVGDYDNDGRRDLYVTNYGPNRLYHNLPSGTFEEVAAGTGVGDSHFGVGCIFLDYDGDSFLDLYVGNYLDYVPDFNTVHSFPGPTAYQGQVNLLFHNDSQGAFLDVTKAAGLAEIPGHTMGVGMVDFNEDGRWDLFVANDAMENFFFENRGNGKFEENALLTNLAYGANGDARGAMGAEVGDINGDGRCDLFVPDFTHTCLYMNQGDGFFDDQAQRAGIAIVCGHYVSWGAALVDLDLDTDLDIYIANGDARELVGQPDLVFVNDGRAAFAEVSRTCGLADLKPRVSRGVASGDLDNDGDIDLVVMNLNDQPVLLRNDTARQGRHWLMLELVGREGHSNRDAIGAVVRCRLPGDDGQSKTLLRQRSSSGSYMCVHDQRLHFGLGKAAVVPELIIRWPDGEEQTLRNVRADQLLRVKQGE